MGTHYRGHCEKVVVRSLNRPIAAFGQPNFVKVDIEGFEEEVLGGLTTDLLNCVFLIEVRTETKSGVFEYFADHEYECFCIDGPDRKIACADEIPGFAHFVFQKTDCAQGTQEAKARAPRADV